MDVATAKNVAPNADFPLTRSVAADTLCLAGMFSAGGPDVNQQIQPITETILGIDAVGVHCADRAWLGSAVFMPIGVTGCSKQDISDAEEGPSGEVSR